MHDGALMSDSCTHVTEELCDILSAVQLIRCLLLQEGKPEMKAEQHINVQMMSWEKKHFLCFTEIFHSLTYRFLVPHTKWEHIQDDPPLSQHRCWGFWRCPRAPSAAWISLRTLNILAFSLKERNPSEGRGVMRQRAIMLTEDISEQRKCWQTQQSSSKLEPWESCLAVFRLHKCKSISITAPGEGNEENLTICCSVWQQRDIICTIRGLHYQLILVD